MTVSNATMEDLCGWMELAAEVEYLFGPMVADPKFVQAIEKNINLNRAFCVREADEVPGWRVLQDIGAPAEVTVITFGEDIQDGLPAKRLYQKFGFVPLEEPVPNGPEGGSRQKFRLQVTNK